MLSHVWLPSDTRMVWPYNKKQAVSITVGSKYHELLIVLVYFPVALHTPTNYGDLTLDISILERVQRRH